MFLLLRTERHHPLPIRNKTSIWWLKMEKKEHGQTECLEFEKKIVWWVHHHLGPCWKFSYFCRKCMFKNRIKNYCSPQVLLNFFPIVLPLISYALITIHYCFLHVSARLPALWRQPWYLSLSILLHGWHCFLLSPAVNNYAHFCFLTQKPSVTLHCP